MNAHRKTALFLILFLGILFVTITFSYAPVSKIFSLGFQNDILLLRDYNETEKRYFWGDFKIEKMSELNQQYGNIFSYFELPANSDWAIVPLKWAGRVIMKAPLYLIIGEPLFPALWKIVGILLSFWMVFIFFVNHSFSERIILFLTMFTFWSYLVSDLEFSTLFSAVIFLLFYFKRLYLPYFFIYLILGLYASIVRTEFFLFFSFLNLYVVIYAVKKKRYAHILYIFIVSLLFITGFLLYNKIYYWWYLITGYEVERDVTNLSINTNTDSLGLSQIFYKLISLPFPLGFNLIQVFLNVQYVLNSFMGIGIILVALPAFLSHQKTKFFDSNHGLKRFIFLFIWYWFILYWSSPYFYKPPTALFSSYSRYFWVFLLLLSFLLYRGFFKVWPLIKSLYISYLLLYTLSSVHFFASAKNDLDSSIYLRQLESKIPKNSVILPLKPVKFILSDYKILQPSGSDTEEHRVFFTYWRTSRNTSLFLDKIGNFIQKTNTPIYLVGPQDQIFKKIALFFQRKGLLLEIHNDYFLIKPNGSWEYFFDWQELED